MASMQTQVYSEVKTQKVPTRSILALCDRHYGHLLTYSCYGPRARGLVSSTPDLSLPAVVVEMIARSKVNGI